MDILMRVKDHSFMPKTKKYRGWWRGCLTALILPLCMSVSVPLAAAAVPLVSSADRQALLSSGVFSPFSWLNVIAGVSPAHAMDGDGRESNPDAGDTFRDGTDATAPQGSRGGSFTESLFFGSPFRGVGLVDLLILAGLGLVAMRFFAARRGQEKKDGFTVNKKGTSTPDNRRPDALSGDARGKIPGKWPERDASVSGKNGWPAGRSSSPPQRDGEKSAGRSENKEPSQRGRPMTVRENAAAHWGRYTGQSDGAQASEEAVEEGVRLPGGFDAGEFLEGARVLYVRLQKAWAARELENLSAFVTEDMMRQLRAQAASNPQPEDVDIILVNALLTDFTRQGREEKATVRFNVVMRSGDAGQSGEIEEQWRFTRGTEPDGMWRLSGIDPTAG